MSLSPPILVGYLASLSSNDVDHLFNGVDVPDGLIVSDSLDPWESESEAARVTVALIDRVKGYLKDHLRADNGSRERVARRERPRRSVDPYR